MREIPEAGSALMWEQQHDRLVKHLSRAQTRAALRRVYAPASQRAHAVVCLRCCEHIMRGVCLWPGC